MKIVVSSNGTDLDAPASPIFGRCPTFVFVEPETMSFEAVENPAVAADGGAGIQAAQFVVGRGAQTVVTGNVGPNAFDIFDAANVSVYTFTEGTVRQAVKAYKAGKLSTFGSASVSEHAGMGRGMGNRIPVPPAASISREEEIKSLKKKASDLRKETADILERLDQLEKGE
ncbi:MAG: dinitrogenase iron-molybdenum cofactor biosynthesis protein [Chloroflexi bacterium]|nr:dinitrogenase iron-molybdenum cofactor biosynthesis protein [Chloroflexota bacterium]